MISVGLYCNTHLNQTSVNLNASVRLFPDEIVWTIVMLNCICYILGTAVCCEHGRCTDEFN